MSFKRIVCLDFDGTCTRYKYPFEGDGIIRDEPIEGLKEFVDELTDKGYHVVIFSTRCRSMEGRLAIQNWCDKYAINISDVYASKPPSIVFIDDRAITFDGTYKGMAEKVMNFEPYYYKNN